MQRSFLTTLAAGIVLLTSCSALPHTSTVTPFLEVEQVTHRWEIVVRLEDPSVPRRPCCRVFVVLENEDGKKVEAHVADLRLKETGEHGSFIGIYSNGKEFPHGTEVVVTYQRTAGDSFARAATQMFYH